MNNMHAAARLCAKRILPSKEAVAQFSRLIRFTKDFAEETQAMVENEQKLYADNTAENAALTLRLSLGALGREKISITTPPQITEAMLPKKRESDEKDENIKGLAELVADLGVAYVLVNEN